MSYDLYITRKADFFEDSEPRIETNEWLALVEHDDSLTAMPENGPYFVAWNGQGEYPCWLDYDEHSGGLWTENPTDEFMEKMDEIAAKLNARVRGEGEE